MLPAVTAAVQSSHIEQGARQFGLTSHLYGKSRMQRHELFFDNCMLIKSHLRTAAAAEAVSPYGGLY